MPRTCAFGCQISTTDKSVSFHTFPKPHKDPDRFIVWINLINTVIPGKFTDISPTNVFRKYKICSRHFDKTDYNRNNRLNNLAVPSLNLPDFKDGQVIPVHSAKCVKRTSVDAEYLESIYDSEDDDHKNEDEFQPQKHESYKCNICSGDIVGFRYRCVQCRDLDMCNSCESKGEHHRHYVLRIPEPRPFSEIYSVLEKIRKVLSSGECPLAAYEQSVESLDCDDKLDDDDASLIKLVDDTSDEISIASDVMSTNSDVTASSQGNDVRWNDKEFYFEINCEEEVETKTLQNDEKTSESFILNKPVVKIDEFKAKNIEAKKSSEGNKFKRNIMAANTKDFYEIKTSIVESDDDDNSHVDFVPRDWSKPTMKTYKRAKKS